ncbi:MAG: methyl-accepting chemotaxis protein [Thiogranum sp.]|nr:methyl-accepting chemotaxis protein [Thiogranum sp.]
MSRICNFGVRKQFAALAAVLAVVVTIVSGMSISATSTISDQAADIAGTGIPALDKAHEVKLAVVQVQQWLTDISATRAQDGLNDGFDEAHNNAERVRQLLAELSALDVQNAARYQAMLPVFEDYYRVGKRMAQAYVDAGPAGGNPMMADFDAVAASIGEEVDAMLVDIQARVAQAGAGQQTAVRTATTLLWIGLVAVLVVIGALYFIIAHALGILPRVVNELQLVADGNLASSFTVQRNDEFGELVQALTAMRQRLVSTIRQITGNSETLSAASQQMSAITAQASASIQQQRSETEQVATAMNEMTATVQEVAGNIALTASTAQDANKETVEGKRVVDQAVGQIKNLARQLEGASETIHQVEHNSQEITSILDVIRGVAEQTNLLALNAAIEAARAGEQGRGFAVVADEVRTLASRTQQSTEEINQMIEKLRAGTGEAVDVMQRSREQARSAVDSAAAAGNSLASITGAVARINDMSTQIASAAEEQSAVSEEINRNIVRINDMTEESAEAAAQTAKASEDLARIAAELGNLVGQFRV